MCARFGIRRRVEHTLLRAHHALHACEGFAEDFIAVRKLEHRPRETE